MLKYYSIFLFLSFSCATSKVAENEAATKPVPNEEKKTKVDDSMNLPAPDIDLSDVKEKEKESEIVEMPDKSASFDGGAEAMKSWIRANLQYPEKAIETSTQGKVYVQFTVLIDGSIDDISILRGVSKEIDEEAKRLIRSMPKWIPGESKGEAVNTRSRIPISFKI